MILTVDVGNTNITFGGFEKDELKFVSKLSSNMQRTEDEFAVRFLESLNLYGIDSKKITGIIGASVVPPLN
ncbi:MAG: type III pantothenate kinase, partial [Clostridia bacterium]|nr:type III pantothenate kinase [Clostridia bacterium]